MNILAIGDVTGGIGCAFLRAHLPQLKKERNIELVIANGENSADGNGITPSSAEFLFASGVDVITTGNHAFRRKECYELYDRDPCLLRPANYPEGTPGKGICIVDKGRVQIRVLNLMGVVYMDSLDDPFRTADRLLAEEPHCPITLVDFHAEATGEKRALAFYLDGRVSALFGTHTHVATADETILPEGTGYITDVGMTGPIQSVLGVKPELSIAKMKNKLPVRFEYAGGPCKMDCVLFSIDERSGKCLSIERIMLK